MTQRRGKVKAWRAAGPDSLRMSYLGEPPCGETRLRGRSPSARRRPEYPAVGTVRACGCLRQLAARAPAAKARAPGLQAVPGSPKAGVTIRGAVPSAVLLIVSSRPRAKPACPGSRSRVAEGMVRLGTNCGTTSEATATPTPNGIIPRRLRNGPRIKSGVTVFGAALSSPLSSVITPDEPCARRPARRFWPPQHISFARARGERPCARRGTVAKQRAPMFT